MAFSNHVATLVFLLAAVPSVFAGTSNIRSADLPQQSAILHAYADTAKLEPMASHWNPEWRYSVTKDEVATRLKLSLAELRKALVSAPDNVELLLLTGLVAHYGYNVDVENTYEVADQCLEKAHKLRPDDYRPEWFIGVHKCQTLNSAEGMKSLLQVERVWERERLLRSDVRPRIFHPG